MTHRYRTMLCACALASVALATAAGAQGVIERNPPPAPEPAPDALRIQEQDFGSADETPLGVDLAGIRVLGQGDAVLDSPPAGVTGADSAAFGGALQAALAPYLGQPLSLALAADIQAAIARVYRQEGRPFVSVTLPEQEVTSGVLQVRLIEFRMGDVAVDGAEGARAAALSSALRVDPGQPIDARALREDLDWINRYAYRRAEGVFEPGSETGLSDLTVTLTPAKPWRAFAGWANSGDKASGRDRYFLGAETRLPILRGALASYQVTGGADVLSDPGRLWAESGDYPEYLSHAGRVAVLVAPRQALEIAPALVATRQQADAFVAFENRTIEAPVVYRSAISNFLPGRYWGDVYGGVEFKTLRRRAFFNDVFAAEGRVDLFQAVLGVSGTFEGEGRRTTVDARIKANPGGVLGGNTDRHWSAFSNGRVTDVTYAYAALDASHIAALGERLVASSQVAALLAATPLPDTERMSLGGLYAVRGYGFGAESADRGAVVRNELRLIGVSAPRFAAAAISPYAFLDVGYGEDDAGGQSETLAGAGLGLDLSYADRVSFSAVAGMAVLDAGRSDAGDLQLTMRLTTTF